MKYHAYTDTTGTYAFRDAKPGTYQVRVKLGDRVLTQVAEVGEPGPVRKLDVPREPLRLDIKVQG